MQMNGEFFSTASDLELAEYFKQKFEGIPDGEIGVVSVSALNCCALGHCGVRMNGWEYTHTVESMAIVRLFGRVSNRNDFGDVWMVNDGCHKNYQQPTPRARILAAIDDIIAKIKAT